jgi:phage terminase large subunit
MTAKAVKETRIRTSRVYSMLAGSKKRIRSLRGGTRSGKTYNTCIYWVSEYLEVKGQTLTIARQTMPALRASAMRDFFDVLDTFGLYDERSHNKTSNEYELNGNLIEFVGLQESRRVRGRKRDDLFLNEANETDLESFRQLALRTRNRIVLDYNPSETHGWIYDDVETRDDCDLFVTNYQDNPFLEKAIVDEIERLKDADPDYWKVYGLGEIANVSHIIYTHWRDASQMPEGGQTVYGLDFGYNNPTALIEVKLYDNTLYWRELLYQSKLTNNDLIERLKEFPELKGRTIVADSAEPNRIEEIARAGYKIEPANKAVKDGIDFVKARPLRIDADSPNLHREIKRYAWKKDKAGTILDEPVKFDDHLLDAARYASYSLNVPPAVVMKHSSYYAQPSY